MRKTASTSNAQRSTFNVQRRKFKVQSVPFAFAHFALFAATPRRLLSALSALSLFTALFSPSAVADLFITTNATEVVAPYTNTASRAALTSILQLDPANVLTLSNAPILNPTGGVARATGRQILTLAASGSVSGGLTTNDFFGLLWVNGNTNWVPWLDFTNSVNSLSLVQAQNVAGGYLATNTLFIINSTTNVAAGGVVDLGTIAGGGAGALTNNWTGDPVTIDAANLNTNIFGGLVTVLGQKVQTGYTSAYGDYSHAQGLQTIASGFASHAAGYAAVASNDYTWVWSDQNGLGASSANNEFTVYASGGIRLLGGVIAGDGAGLTDLNIAGSGGVTNGGFQIFTNSTLAATVSNGGSVDILSSGGGGEPPKFRAGISPMSGLAFGSTNDALVVGVSGDNAYWGEAQFSDTTEQRFRVTISPAATARWTGGALTNQILWRGTSTVGTVAWQIGFIGATNGGLVDLAYQNLTIGSNTVSSVTSNINVTTIIITPTNTPAGSLWLGELRRLPSLDTMVNDARMLHWSITE